VCAYSKKAFFYGVYSGLEEKKMNLTRYTEYSLRILMHLGLESDRRVFIREIAEVYGIPRNHLIKVVTNLSKRGYILTKRGKSGGMRLAREASEINVGTTVRDMEPNCEGECQDCFIRPRNDCAIEPECILKGILHEARESFFNALNRYTLADLLRRPDRLKALLNLQ